MKSKIAKEILDNIPKEVTEFVRAYGNAKVNCTFFRMNSCRGFGDPSCYCARSFNRKKQTPEQQEKQ